MPIWTFLDYVNDSGVNVIADWAKGLSSKRARAKFHSRITYLQALKKEQWGHKSGAMTGTEWNDIYEIRFEAENIQYRPFFCFGPERQEVTILMGAEERGGAIEPRSAAATCQLRRAEIKEGGRNHVTPHDFSA